MVSNAIVQNYTKSFHLYQNTRNIQFSGFLKLNNNDIHKICVTKIIRILQLKRRRGDAEGIYI